MNPDEIDYGKQYREFHSATPEHVAEMNRRSKELFFKHLPQRRDFKVLDIGCGMGFHLLYLQTEGFKEVSGIDTDRSQVEAAKAFGLSVERVTDSIAYLNERPGQFGLILLLDVLEHVPLELELRLMKAIHQALIPGGRVIVQVPNANSPLSSMWRYMDFTHYTTFTNQSLAFVLRNAGFQKISMPATGHIRRPAWYRLFSYGGRLEFRFWFFRWIWKQMYLAEVGQWMDVGGFSFDLNLMAIADKD
jgi:2-polyprenyl-3-methyl-5-hydroxy-6-metoxy-1,4-benzoquinol methylase